MRKFVSPGIGANLLGNVMAATLHWKFARIQFTPDLMPSDITGYELLERDGRDGSPRLTFRRGPVFANLVLPDEINRAAPKTQSALLETMAERQVTVGGETHHLKRPMGPPIDRVEEVASCRQRSVRNVTSIG